MKNINCRSGPIDIYSSEGCPQINKTIILIRGLGKCERESVRTRDLSWSCRHSSRIMHLLECVFNLEHCTTLRWRVAHLGRFHY